MGQIIVHAIILNNVNTFSNMLVKFPENLGKKVTHVYGFLQHTLDTPPVFACL